MRVTVVPVGAPTGVPVVEPSTPGLAVVAAAAVRERPGPVPEGEDDLLAEPVVGVAPVREEGVDVLAEPRHAIDATGLERASDVLGTGCMGCHDAPVREPPGTPEPAGAADAGASTSLRLAGFGLTALGGLLIGIGSLSPWIRSSLEGLPDAISPTYLGIDLTEGLIALAAGIVVLVALAATRIAASPGGRQAAAWAVIAGSIVAIGAAGAAVVTGADRTESTAVQDILAELNPQGNPSPEQRTEVEELVVTTLAPGPFAVLGGGLLGLVGGALLLSWARRSTDADRSTDDQAGPVVS